MANRDYDQDRGGMGRGYDDRDRMGHEGGRGWMDRAREYFDRAREMGRDFAERDYSNTERYRGGGMGGDYNRPGMREQGYDRGGYDRGDYDRDYGRGGTGGGYGGQGRGFGSMGGNSYVGRGDLGDRNPSQGFTGGYGGGYGQSYASSGGGFGQGDAGQSDASRGGYGQGSGYYGEGGGSGRQSHAGRGSKNYRRSDQRIEEEVHEVLMRHHEIDATDVDVRVENGEVTLTGEVEDRGARRLAEELVERCGGVRDVHNNLKARRGLLDRVGDALGVGDADRDQSRGTGGRDATTTTVRSSSNVGATGTAGMGTTGGSTGTTGGSTGPTSGTTRGTMGTTDPGVR